MLLLSAAGAWAADKDTRVIVSSTGPREVLRNTIQRLGGAITDEYANVNAVAAIVPASAQAALSSVPEFKVSKDMVMYLTPTRDLRGAGVREIPVDTDGTIALDEAALKSLASSPNDYTFNNDLINASTVQAGGNLGQDVVVALIDSGTANYSGVATLTGTVIGGENFSGDTVSATSRNNGPHGTWTGSMIAGHAGFLVSKTGCLGQSMAFNAPSSVLDGTPYGFPTSYVLPITGVAPGAKIYAMKVFAATSSSTPSSRIIAAMDRAITMKKNYLAGHPAVPVSGSGTEDDPFVYDSLNIKVLNMSLGGPTMIAGRDVEDQLVQQMLSVGMTVAVSSGNAGPSGLTTGTPSTSFASISSAAATTPTHERIYLDYTTCTPGFGTVYRPSNAIQTAYFSSRGPTADGRIGVDVTTAGDYNFAQGSSGGLYFVSGTSFAAPTVAGAAALIRKAVPSASAAQVRNAIILATNHNLLGDNSGVFDQGAGYLDVAHSIKLLQTWWWLPGWILPSLWPSGEVEDNLQRLWLRVDDLAPGRTVSGKAVKLLPGQRREFYLEVGKDVGGITISVNGVTPENDPAQQNQIYGDDLIFAVHSAKTSAIGEGDYKVGPGLITGPMTFTIPNPEAGILRVTFTGDWTNAGRVSADYSATATLKGKPNFHTKGKVGEGDTVAIPFNVPAGTGEADFELTWNHDWASYPTNDIDMILVAPDGTFNFDGATINGLERAAIQNPQAGMWQILVNGYTIYDRIGFDRWKKDKEQNTEQYRVDVFLK
ncbi:MAG: S8 family serine peptidase [Acidobacteriia bacterium]|nr:S8 family serine peptidase [Terriglobia bacterium]